MGSDQTGEMTEMWLLMQQQCGSRAGADLRRTAKEAAAAAATAEPTFSLRRSQDTPMHRKTPTKPSVRLSSTSQTRKSSEEPAVTTDRPSATS
ncbi:uncharacterized protein V6R79_006894 [Siganus canaliculatus]